MAELAKEVLQVNLEDEMRQSYMDYAMSVIVGRALPDVRDGLKPVHRRVLFAMSELGNDWNKAYKKSARVVGDVIGKYHPHGDSAVYDTIVRMAQPFAMRHMLVDGQGNFGSVDGDAPAAMRYTEVRMDKPAAFLLADIDKDTVDFQDNYDGKDQEPSVLPARFPNMLVNGAGGQGRLEFAVRLDGREVDLAVIVAPAKVVPSIITDCGESGVGAAIVISANFSEAGPKGAALEAEMLRRARRYGMRILGPNCLGVIRPRVGLNATFAKSHIATGHVALVAQSGAFCTALLDWADAQGFGFSAVASTGI